MKQNLKKAEHLYPLGKKVPHKHPVSLVWERVNGDDLPSGLDYAVLDFAMDTDHGVATRMLQNVIGTDQTGQLSREDIKLLGKLNEKSTKLAVEALCALRNTLGQSDANRVNKTLKDALSMVEHSAPPKEEHPKATGKKPKGKK